MTDPTIETGDHRDKADSEAAELVDAGDMHAELMGSPALNHIHDGYGSNGICLPSKTMADPKTDVGDHQEKAGGMVKSTDAGLLLVDKSPVRTRIHRGGSGGIFRSGSGGIHRGASGAIHRGPSGGILRGLSAGVHLPTLQSITFEMTRLPEEDAGVLMHFTETKEVVIPVETPRASTRSDDDAPPRKKSRLRKTLTAVGACSFGFRLSEAVLSFIAIVVMCSNSQAMRTDKAHFGTLRFNHFQAYRYLVAVNVCVFVYSTIQFVQLTYTVILGISFIPSILISTWLTYGFDQLFSYLLLSASTSAATIANMSYNGEMGVHLCSRFDLNTFCARADAAVTMSFFTFLAMFSSTALALYRIGVLLKEL